MKYADAGDVLQAAARSPSARRAWVEIMGIVDRIFELAVALREEGVG